MAVLLVLTASTFILPGVFARHAARLVYDHIHAAPKDHAPSKEELVALFSKPGGARVIRLAYRWGTAAALLSLARWPLVVLVVVLVLV